MELTKVHTHDTKHLHGTNSHRSATTIVSIGRLTQECPVADVLHPTPEKKAMDSRSLSGQCGILCLILEIVILHLYYGQIRQKLLL